MSSYIVKQCAPRYVLYTHVYTIVTVHHIKAPSKEQGDLALHCVFYQGSVAFVNAKTWREMVILCEGMAFDPGGDTRFIVA